MRLCRYLVAVVAAALSLPVSFAAEHEIRIASIANEPLSALVKQLGWLEAELRADASVQWLPMNGGDSGGADFVATGGEAALRLRANGEPIRAVFVLSRGIVGSGEESVLQLLSVREGFASANPLLTARVLRVFDRARRWTIANPEAAAVMLSSANQTDRALARAHLDRTDFVASAPGPSQAVALKNLPSVLGGLGPFKDSAALGALVDALIDRPTARAALGAAPDAHRACGSLCDRW